MTKDCEFNLELVKGHVVFKIEDGKPVDIHVDGLPLSGSPFYQFAVNYEIRAHLKRGKLCR